MGPTCCDVRGRSAFHHIAHRPSEAAARQRGLWNIYRLRCIVSSGDSVTECRPRISLIAVANLSAKSLILFIGAPRPIKMGTTASP